MAGNTIDVICAQIDLQMKSIPVKTPPGFLLGLV